VTTQVPAQGLIGDVACDSSGNLYFRPLTSAALTAPLVRVNPRGEKNAEFDVTAAPDFRDKNIIAPVFALDKFGRVHFLVRQIATNEGETNRTYLVSYALDGGLPRTTELAILIRPYALAVFNSGTFFAMGVEEPSPRGTTAPAPPGVVAALFDQRGQLLRNLTLPAKEPAYETTSAGSGRVNPVIVGASAAVGADGYLYVLLGSAIQVFSQAGDRVRSISLTPPVPGATPHGFRLVPGRLIARFAGPEPSTADGTRKPRKILYAVYDLLSGELVTAYEESESVRGLLACAEPGKLTLLVPNNGSFAIVGADMQ
jgi:hypothetical protein